MGRDPDREPPFFFMKPTDAAFDSGPEANASIPYPPQTANLHHEIELTVAIGTGGTDIAVEDALDHVFGYCVSVDLTRRDLQTEAKDAGRPWEWGKAFDRSAPMAPIGRRDDAGGFDPTRGRISLAVDDEVRQEADLSELIWPVADTIAIISRSMELQPGDLIMTETPAGVGSVDPGQTLRGSIEGLADLVTKIERK